ncbi:Uncharacterised protein [Metamycoplasma cloacale]|uniref:Uncharacterized protein n=1 Tax=Metamycoplasma cloacale TaxID=92401 RepID=A0A2Z4LM47_9BACT|nr:hypothetical protein [Metamycoplasma cloacale]AWX42806.1 hypothetical protein DK849_01875 [Metamycoplasma cloacale]VEU79375.1 Uncharacterised protein [Metamycoplasma cloacale]
MYFKNKKRIILYELKLRYFNHINSSSAIDDILNLNSKIAYFNQMNINVVSVNDFFDTEYLALNNHINFLNSNFLEEFQTIIGNFKTNNIDLAVTLDLKSIRNSYMNLQNLVVKDAGIENESNTFVRKTIDDYLLNTQEFIQKNINNLSSFLNKFNDLISFYFKLGINCFVLDNFEYLINETINESQSYRVLEDIYKTIKHYSNDNIVILKTNFDCNKKYNQFIYFSKTICDYLYLNLVNSFGINKKLMYAKVNKINYKNIKKNILPYLKDSSYILGLNNDKFGRFLSKFDVLKSYTTELYKTYLMLINSGKNSIGLYYGDELPILGASIYHANDLNDDNYNEIKRYYESRGISNKKYFNNRKILDSINNKTYLPWNNDNYVSNFDYDKNNRNKISLDYEKYNVENQLNNRNSFINFIKYLNEIRSNDVLSNLFIKGKLTVKKSKNVIKIYWKYKEIRIVFLINIDCKFKHLWWNSIYDDWNIIASTYIDKFYNSIVNLQPYESIILFKNKHNNNN